MAAISSNVLVFLSFSLDIANLLCDGLKGFFVIRVLRLQLWKPLDQQGQERTIIWNIPCCFLAETCCDIVRLCYSREIDSG